MTTHSSVEWLSAAIKQATKSTKYCITGDFPGIDPGLVVEGLGSVPVPLKPKQAKAFLASCSIAPFGKGTQTLVDRSVRNTYELNPRQFHLSEAWNLAVANLVSSIACELGLPSDQLIAQLYKLLVYERGGFFLPHRDSEKQNGMVASLVVVLPNSFEGGQLRVRHRTSETKVNFESAALRRSPCYAAFFTDCEHEVTRVDNGRRICLTYNLILRTPRKKHTFASTPTNQTEDAIRTWTETQPGNPLVIALEHEYTARGLSLDLLKGADRKLAETIVPAAQNAGCLIYFSQVERHLVQFADDGSFDSYDRGYRFRPQRRKIEVGETYEDDLRGIEWTDLQGTKQPWNSIPLKVPAIVSSIPLEKWKPTSEQFEGYTGNAGNTLDRWYRRTALAVWRQKDHFEVIASGDFQESLSLFQKMFAKLAKTAKRRQEQARQELVLFAGAIIRRWSKPGYFRRYGSITELQASEEKFAAALAALQDKELISTFLSELADECQNIRLGQFLRTVCTDYGSEAFAPELNRLMSPKTNRAGNTVLSKWTVDWLVEFCTAGSPDAHRTVIAQQLCAMAVDQFCVPSRPPRYLNSDNRAAPTELEALVPDLARALLAIGSMGHLLRLINFIQDHPHHFRLEECHVPALKILIPWSQKAFGEVPDVLSRWLTDICQKLRQLTAQAPASPSDWKRTAVVDCNCRYCAELNTFLADPMKEVGRIAASENNRWHLTMNIQKYDCDITSTLEKKGSPYSLILKKTTRSFERALNQFRAHEKMLKELSE